ncbi:putative UDP-glucuronic acid decarboxylase 1 [Paratrimastix pyriformis]|uniref:UDP-glucuronic acid decarboxylase 1 n=1 Tax=Paratrimastix pyriformis TaxID=342808 RepID=A0ABQ8U5L2_9EUKA|nr:putative UDP-glucuronic acid decarboxylase 1 [Paratrimastix pyriformis]
MASPAPAPAPFCPKRILVTGGAGFIGSHLCKRLVNEGHDVICLDNLFTGDKLNIAELLTRPNFEFIRHDIVDPIKLEVDQIYNLACPASPPHYQYNPIKTMQTSVLGIMNMLELARHLNCPILQASTSEVYGDALVHPQRENYWGNVNCAGIRSCYDEGKRAAETLLFDYNRMYKTKVRVVRIFNTYGPNMHPYDGRVVSNFIRQALNNEPITIFGSGDQTRSFQFVDDLVEGMVRMMNNTNDFIGPVNLGNPGEFTIKQLAEMVIRMTGSQSQLVYRELPGDDPCRRRPDNSLAREKLGGWQPVVQLEQGLERTIAYFRSINANLAHYRPPTKNF